ncbi:helicase-related protein [Hymenobacter saemangeumensis]|uniref:Helicase-related protein n=1 Tax=Hymenobacter saemangeumensis TaxID=1084522 RepID=A0ABP8IRI1_9BACT
MLALELLKPGLNVIGLEPGTPVQLLNVDASVGDDVRLVAYRRPNGQLTDVLLTRDDESRLSEAAATERAWSFAADGNLFTLATEAHRIRLAHLFDPLMAVHSSDVEPLPHQITAVYDAMLTRQPLRFVLADDPGAGKTVMAGLLIRELLMRADARRILIVAPGSLTEQWQDELRQKFGLEFPILSSALAAQTASGNVFDAYDLLVARVDQLARNTDWRALLDTAQPWDLVVVDEAHKLAAHWSGQEVRKTIRFGLGEQLGRLTRHFLLMTATPHNGKEEDFQLFMSLLDAERFYGRFRDGRTEPVDASDLMRRLVKEQLRTFDNRPLFPERRPYTLAYDLSPAENDLYQAVTHYVIEQMDRADKLDGRRRSVAGFALTALQRRLASSPGSIYKSLNRRRERLEERLKQTAQQAGVGGHLDADGWFNADVDDLPTDEWEDAWSAGEREEEEENITSQATTARTVRELQAEVQELRILETQARTLVQNPAQTDCKWEKLRDTLTGNELMQDPTGGVRKLIIFTEYRDTLLYLQERLTRLLGDSESVVRIDGATPRPERLMVQDRFRNDERVRVLLATDAAGEGINLQNAHLMVNYDLPWNPNRLEQRFGRIHRIGQKEVCHLFNLVAAETREGAVYKRLLDKLEQINKDLPGRVFDVLGEVFEGTSLRKMLEEAIRYGDRPDVRAKLTRQLDDALDTDHLNELLQRNALYEEVFGPTHLQAIREQMDQAEARKLQPYYVRYFTEQALARLKAELRPMEADRFRIPYVPALVRDRARELGSSDRRQVLDRYERVCFEKHAIRRERMPMAELLHPGHLLVCTLTDLITEQGRSTLTAGATLLDPLDETGTEPRLLFLLEHTVRDQTGAELSQRLQFVWVRANDDIAFAGWAPHLDLHALPPSSGEAVRTALAASPLLSQTDPAGQARRFATRELAPEHGREVRQRREAYVDKVHAAVLHRLTRELEFWDDAIVRAQEEKAAGKSAADANLRNATQTHRILRERLDSRLAELERMRAVQMGVPTILGGALVVPAGLLRQLGLANGAAAVVNNENVTKPPISAEARQRVELAAMAAVEAAEKALGHSVTDVSAKKCGWDLTTTLPAQASGRLPKQRHLEVKGRAAGHDDTVVLTRNELMEALNQADKFVLALVLVHPDGRTEGPYYIPRPFGPEHLPPPEMVQGVFKLSALLGRAVATSDYYAALPAED